MKFLALALSVLTGCLAIPSDHAVRIIEHSAAHSELLFNVTLSVLSWKGLGIEQEAHIRECYYLGLINEKGDDSGKCNSLLVPGSGEAGNSFAPSYIQLTPDIAAELPNARQVMRHALTTDRRHLGALTTTDADVLETPLDSENNLLLSGLLQLTTHHIAMTRSAGENSFFDIINVTRIEHDPSRCYPIDEDDPARYMRPPIQEDGSGGYVTAYPSTVISNPNTPTCRALNREVRDPATNVSQNMVSAFSDTFPFYDDKHRRNGGSGKLCELNMGNHTNGELFDKRGHTQLAVFASALPHYKLQKKWFLSAEDTGRIIDPFTGAPFAVKRALDTPDSRTNSNTAMFLILALYYEVHNELCADLRADHPYSSEDELYKMAHDRTVMVAELHMKEAIEHVVGESLDYMGYEASESADVPIDLAFTLRSHTVPPNTVVVFDADTLEPVRVENATVYYENGTESGHVSSHPVILLNSGQGSPSNGEGLPIMAESGGPRNLLATGLMHPMSRFDLSVPPSLDFAFRSVPHKPSPFDFGELSTDNSIPTTSLIKSRENRVPVVGQKYPEFLEKHASCANDTTSLECFRDFLDRETNEDRVLSMHTLYLNASNVDLMLATWANTDTLRAEWTSAYRFMSSSDRFWFERKRPGWKNRDVNRLKRHFNLCKTIDRHFGNLCTDLTNGNPFSPRVDVYESANTTALSIEFYEDMRAATQSIGQYAEPYPGRFDVKYEPLLPGERTVRRGD